LLLQASPEWQVIAEASDGSEAIQKAEELKPDLIVLDLGLPKLNGIEAARRIRRLSPSSRIVFLSQNDDLDVVWAALATGALGYVHKTKTRQELLSAVDAALQGRQFVSSTLRRSKFSNSQGVKAAHCHEVQFYADDAVFLDTLARFIGVALKTGAAAIAVTTESHRDSLILSLKAQGLDVDAAMRQGTYVQLDATKTLSTFMVNGMPDPARFLASMGDLIKAAAEAAKGETSRVVACGECSPVLWAEGKADAAIRAEQLWDEVVATFDVDILCGYALSSFDDEEHADVFQDICAEHSAIHSH